MCLNLTKSVFYEQSEWFDSCSNKVNLPHEKYIHPISEMSSEIAPSTDKTEKPVEPLAESDNRNGDNTSTDEVDAAPSRRSAKVASAHWHTQPLGERPAPLAQEEDETDIMDPMQR